MYFDYRLVSFGSVLTQWGLSPVLRPRSGGLQLEVLLRTHQKYGLWAIGLLDRAKVLVCRIEVHTTVLHVVQLEWVWLLLLERT